LVQVARDQKKQKLVKRPPATFSDLQRPYVVQVVFLLSESCRERERERELSRCLGRALSQKRVKECTWTLENSPGVGGGVVFRSVLDVSTSSQRHPMRFSKRGAF